jgi:hypothetical protein
LRLICTVGPVLPAAFSNWAARSAAPGWIRHGRSDLGCGPASVGGPSAVIHLPRRGSPEQPSGAKTVNAGPKVSDSDWRFSNGWTRVVRLRPGGVGDAMQPSLYDAADPINRVRGRAMAAVSAVAPAGASVRHRCCRRRGRAGALRRSQAQCSWRSEGPPFVRLRSQRRIERLHALPITFSWRESVKTPSQIAACLKWPGGRSWK